MTDPVVPHPKVWRHRRLMSEHAFDKLRDLDCGFAEFEAAPAGAVVIEETEFGSESIKELVLLVAWKAPLHVVVVVDHRRREERLVTVYRPDRSRWAADYGRRR